MSSSSSAVEVLTWAFNDIATPTFAEQDFKMNWPMIGLVVTIAGFLGYISYDTAFAGANTKYKNKDLEEV